MATRSAVPEAKIGAGAILHRVHVAGVSARWYGRKDATWRWDDPAGGYGILYLGKSAVGPFAETLLRTPTDRHLLWEQVARRRTAAFVTLRPIRLAKLHGPGLAWFLATTADLAADFDPITNPGAYIKPQQLLAQINKETALDGIQYRSRFDSDQFCIALFERADAAITLREEGVAIEKAWVKAILKPRGYRLIEF